MPKTSTESVNTTITTSLPTSTEAKSTVSVFDPAKPAITSAQSSMDSVQPNSMNNSHHKANHNQNRSIEQSSHVVSANAPVDAAPKIGFVSLGCPKALVDSERIITELSRDGYQVASDYNGADLVVVNTCGFIESAVQESLDAIGEAISKNGKVIVTGCLGKEADKIREMHPAVLAVTGAHAYDEVITAVAQHVPKPNRSLDANYDPKIDLINEAGVKLTPSHYAYLKISEGCNHRCTFCIIPSLRGDLVSRPIDNVMNEAMALKNAGVKELLIISQDTSAYGLISSIRPAFGTACH